MTKRISFTFGFVIALLLGSPSAPADTEALDRIVAIVNNDVITDLELKKRIDTIVKQLEDQRRRLPPEDILREQVLERLVVEKIQLQLADETGVKIDDNTLNNTLRRIADENKLSLGQFRDTLERDGYDFTTFREDIRRELIIRRLQERQVMSRILITAQDVEEYIASQAGKATENTEYHLGHILVSIPENPKPEQIEAAQRKIKDIADKLKAGQDFAELAIAYSDSQQALNGGDLGWRKLDAIPTLFTNVVPQLAVGGVSDIIRAPNGFHLIKVFEQRGEAAHVIKQTKVRHILLKTNTLRNDDATKEELEKFRARILAGEDFANLARQYSDDKASADKGGSLDWVAKSDMVPAFGEVMDATAIGQISNAFKSDFGWHILQVEDRRDFDDTKEYQRNQVRQTLQQRKAEEEIDNWLRRLRDEAYVELRTGKPTAG